jgi:hypothetical protein
MTAVKSTDLEAHTPWRAAPWSSVVGCGVVGKRGMVIATIPGPKEHAEPIARLLAAAPDLLEACRAAWALGHRVYHNANAHEAAPDWATVRALLDTAIAKAEGRT